MASSSIRELHHGYTAEVDGTDEEKWYGIMEKFDDANIYQTWAHGIVTSGRQNVSHLLLKDRGTVVAGAQARIAKVPWANVGIAYVRWGPLWRRRGAEESLEVLRQAVRALRNEYACKRGLVVRLLPVLFETDGGRFAAVLEEEGFTWLGSETRSRTILMDVRPELQDLRAGMRPHWRRELKIAERRGLEVVEGWQDELFEGVIGIHREMLARKRFTEGSDINQFRLVQAQLPERFKMKVMLCRWGENTSAGLVCSAMGRTAIYLFGATGNAGMKSNGSYLLHWKLIEQLKREGRCIYDLNGINPEKNPGTYKFKRDLAGQHGKEASFLGQFESYVSVLSHRAAALGERVRRARRRIRTLARGAPA